MFRVMRVKGWLQSEQGILRLSIAITLLVAVFGIVFGLMSGSFSIVFDGFYSLIDAAMSGLALIVATLIRRHTAGSAASLRLVERFNMGFWHLEPMVLALNGTLLCGITLYAAVNAMATLLGGGQALEFGYAITYASVASVVCFAAAMVTFRANINLRSEFVALDAKAWLMSGSISAALLIAFVIGSAIRGTAWDWLAPYVDPVVLLTICLFLLPLPLITMRKAYRDILMVTPHKLKDHVHGIAEQVVEANGFKDFAAYIAKVGRARQIELYFIVPTDYPARSLSYWDDLRDKIGESIGESGPDRWLTIAFTTDPQWAR